MKHKVFTLVMSVALMLCTTPIVSVTAETMVSQTVSPSKVTAKAKKTGKIVVKWTKIKGVSSYKVYRATKRNGKYKLVKTTKGRKFVDKKIYPKKTYFYKVLAKNENVIQVASDNKPKIASAKLKIKKSFKVKAYAYTGGGTTKSGKKAKVGRIAVDPKVIKLGTWLYVEGYGICQACDTGGSIKGKTIDVYKNTQKQVSKWGVKKPKVYILG